LAGLTADLTPAPRRQDHTSSPYALAPFVIGTTSVHRDPSHVRDDHDTPLFSGRDGDRYATVRPSGKAKYFLFWGLTLFPIIGTDLPVGAICHICSLGIAIYERRDEIAFARCLNLQADDDIQIAKRQIGNDLAKIEPVSPKAA
jgi:hypothetical protein